MCKFARLLAVALLASAVPLAAMAAGPLAVKEVGSFYVGGGEVSLTGLPMKELVFAPGAPVMKIDPNGDFEAGQMYVQYVRLEAPRAKYPLLMWHGGGLTGASWETTPDGRPGWQMFFLRAGHDVYVSDAVERGRASWARYPEIYKSEPFFRSKEEAWELFRFGPQGSYSSDPELRKAQPGLRFPVAAFDQLAKQGVPRWATNDATIQAAYDALVQKVGPCVIIAHSQGASFATRAALKAPDKVKAVILIEGSAGPDLATSDLTTLRGVPHLFVWGDYLDQYPFWQKIVAARAEYRDALAAAGVPVEWVELPKRGIAGNSHMLMMDANADEVAAIVQDWLNRNGLMK